ncbi:hypothetical protein EJB05_25794, partial [Eragrostis curvula]
MSYPGGHLLFVYYLISLMALEAAALSFHYNFSIPGDAADLTYINDSYSTRDRIELTANIKGKSSVGRVAYRHPVRLWDSLTGKVANFTTSFSFAIGGNHNNTRGDGMAFFVGPFPPSLPPDSFKHFLGLFSDPEKATKPSPPTVAVEFDTWRNTEGFDSPGVGADHLGIDVNSIRSISTKDLPNLGLYGTMWAEIVYDAGSKLMTVTLRLADGSTYRDQATVDLRAAGLPQNASVGFSASMGTFSESHQLLSWSFNSTDVVTDARGLGDARWRSRQVSLHITHVDCHANSSVAREFSYNELRAATGNFSESNKIGAGSFGEVFRGVLCGQQVAVKKLTHLSEVTRKGYITEVMTLGQLNHRNLVKLVGWGDGGSNDKLLLVYELITNRDLDNHLHGSERLLTWPERYKIVLGIGHGIEYLHTGCKNNILHRDIKPSNVMLDGDFEAKLCDFGLVKQLDPGQGYLRGTRMIGSPDYMDPLIITTNEASTASDMYSFGVLLLEVATGKKPEVTIHEGRVLSNALIDVVSESDTNGTVLELADERLNGDFDQIQMERVLSVGLLCVRRNRKDRPDIRDAVDLLSNLSRPIPQTMDAMATLTSLKTDPPIS